jgi:hypothetical protein
MYVSHPSPELNALFARKPYQGVDPDEATFLFVGLDANYADQIDQHPIFSEIREYHNDGVAFWRKNGVHHPFLLPSYSGDGQFYHRSFARIGFGVEHANIVSFIELLHVPTVGRSKIAATDLDLSHLKRLNSVILEGAAAHIFLPKGVVLLMRKTGVFPWLENSPIEKSGSLGVLFRNPTKTVYSHLHFSVYGKHERQKVEQAAAIQSLF